MAVPPKIIFNEDYGFVEIVIVYKMKLLCLSFGTNCDFRVLFPDGSGYVFWVAFVSSFWVLRIVSVHLSWGGISHDAFRRSLWAWFLRAKTRVDLIGFQRCKSTYTFLGFGSSA